jgi:amidohydrolase
MYRHYMRLLSLALTIPISLILFSSFALAQASKQGLSSPLHARIDAAAQALEAKVIAWRRDIHEFPELSNQEKRTAALVAEHLRKLGIEVKTGVAVHGVVGILKGGKHGPVVALRADMDALPVVEDNDLAFRSKVKTQFNNMEVGVMHACGHDTHVAMLMGVAEILAGMRADIPGTVKFIFQPAEEGAPEGEEGGAELMVKQGVLENPKPEVIFGTHVSAGLEAGKISYRSGPLMAAVDELKITVRGRQTHGARPWGGVDPIVASSQIIQGLQTIISRQSDLTKEPAVITIGSIHGGVRGNIIPDKVDLWGTIRTFDSAMQNGIHARIKTTAEMIAKSAGATAEVKIRRQYPLTNNDPVLTEFAVSTLQTIAGKANVNIGQKTTGAEDFSFYQRVIPGFFFFLGASSKGDNNAASNHSPFFYVDESTLSTGVRSMAGLTVEYMTRHAKK